MNFACTSWRRTLTLTLALGLAAGAQQTAVAPQATAPKAQKSKISQRDAQELLRSVDQIVEFVSEETNLPVRHPVERKLASAEEVKALFRERLRDDEETQRLERSEAVLKKLGLVPRDFKLAPFFEALMEEQVAGFYDERTRVVYLLDWVEPWEQKPVLAHELTHALQDQAISLKKWSDAAEKEEDVVEKGKKPESEEGGFEVRTEEAFTARTALIEGQAMFVLIDYLYAPSGQSLATNPLLAGPFKAASTDSPQYPVLKSAPFYLKESLSFPYTYGLEFVQELLLKGGRAKAFAGALREPPRNTRDIMTPRSYFSHERVPAFHVPALKPLLGPGYERFDVGTLGQFDVQVMVEQFADGKTAKRLAPAWRGGFYYAARKLPEKDARAAKATASAHAVEDRKQAEEEAKHPVAPESLALVYLSRWDSPESAAKFANFYAGALLERYRFAQGADEPAKAAAPPPARRKWMTDAGPVFIEQRGEWVLALESFDEATAGKLADAILAQAKVLPGKP